MQFEDLWEEVSKHNVLPRAAVETIPDMLSETTKEKLLTLQPYEVCSIIKSSIDEIHDGTVVSLNSIVLRKITGGEW